MSEEKFNPKAVMEISKKSNIGAIVFVETYNGFIELIEKSENVADTIGEVEKAIETKLQVGKDIKAVVDTFARPLKSAETQVRAFLTQYMVENDIERFDGEVTKSITLQKAKTTKGIISTREMKVKNKFVPIDDLSKDDLVEMLEALGVKTRITTKEASTTKDASIRVQK
jgi:hypothetical protein